MQAPIPLYLLRPGEEAEVAELVGRPDEVQRLAEIGFQTGALVEMVQSGAPCIIRLAGHKLCFREGESFQVLVRSRAAG
jgi:Fe2+ transport system protein FeoA